MIVCGSTFEGGLEKWCNFCSLKIVNFRDAMPGKNFGGFGGAKSQNSRKTEIAKEEEAPKNRK